MTKLKRKYCKKTDRKAKPELMAFRFTEEIAGKLRTIQATENFETKTATIENIIERYYESKF